MSKNSNKKKKNNNSNNFKENNKKTELEDNDIKEDKEIENTNSYKKNISKSIESIHDDFKNNSNKDVDYEKVENTQEESDITPQVEEVKRDYNYRNNINNNQNNKLVNFILVMVLIIGVFNFFITLFKGNITNIFDIISLLSIMLFTISFCVIGISINIKKKRTFLIGSLCLALFFLVSINNSLLIIKSDSRIINFIDMELTEVMKWAQANNLELNQEYEYSDLIDEYHVISQKEKIGTKIKGLKNITVAISEGPSPFKEIMVPNMVTWDSERVLEFIRNNHLSNVKVEFRESEEVQNTVIEQDKVGNLRRNEEINLVFSHGSEVDFEEVKIIDLKNKSRFEAEFYFKQHCLKYKFEEDFDKKIKKGNVKGQSVKPGEMVKVNDTEVVVTLSKGPEIKVPDLTKMSNSELIEWLMKNKLKAKFIDQYDANVKKNKIVSANYKDGDVIAQGTVIEVTLSKGAIKMKKFSNFNEFREWADKYGIKYEEQHEFNDSVKIGEVISYSYKNGETIKNNDTIIVKISDGEKISVPNLVGLTKKEIESKLNKLNLNYSYLYQSSYSVDEGKAIKQSISKDSDVSAGTTITITISTGKPKNNNNNNSNSGSSGNNNTTPTTPSCDKSKGAELNIQAGAVGSETKTIISQLNPNHKFNFSMVDSCPNGVTERGTVCIPLDGVWKNFCDTITITIVK